MLLLPAAAQIHLARETRRLTVCGAIYKKDGTSILCTQHDDDIEITSGDFSGTYFALNAVTASDVKSSSDLSVDNMEIAGFLADGFSFSGFTSVDIEAGLFDDAPFETFLCQWDEPTAWQRVIRRGYIGEISRTAEGSFQAEWRGLLQLLQQQIGRTYGELCDVKRFGDARCRVDIEPMRASGVVTSVISRRRFNATMTLPDPLPAGGYRLGEFGFTTGANVGFLKQVKQDSAGGTLGEFELWESVPYVVQIGDQFSVGPGCDRRFEICKAYGNQVQFKGHGRWIPGVPNIIRAP